MVLRHQRQRALGIETAPEAQDGTPEVERGQQRVHEAAGPRPIGRRPEQILSLRKNIVRVDESGQVAEHALLRHERALRRPGRAARVNQQRRIGGTRGDRGETVGSLCQHPFPVLGSRLARAGGPDDVSQARQLVADRNEIGKRRWIADGDLGFGIFQPIFQSIGPEQE